MISLITGLPGAGKTSLMVHMLMTRKDLQNRPLYVDGIPELKIPHETVPEGEDMTTWHKWAPTGSILIIDEAQRVFRPRPSGSKVPDFIQELETHRHKGIDIFVLTQHPRLIDVNLRSLIGEHRNISSTLLGIKRVSYWQRCANPESRSDVSDAKNSIFLMKKDAFGMYKSAEEHNKISGSKSIWVYALPLIIMFVVYQTMNLNKRYDERVNPQSQQVQQTQEIQQSSSVVEIPKSSYEQASSSSMPSETRKSLSEDDFKPDIEGKPWTAPAYDNFNRNYQTMPFPVACVKNGKKCTCYTDQGTRIKDLAKNICLDYVENGIYNPYKRREEQTKSQVEAKPSEPSAPVVMVLDG